MPDDLLYDAAIIGGGLAGLSLSIQLAREGYTVVLMEKEEYPLRRVCGEYISMESWDFLESLGINLSSLGVSKIKTLEISSVKGRSFEQDLPLGGFGISRYLLDATLAGIAVRSGVALMQQTRVNEMNYLNDEFIIGSSRGSIRAKVAAGCYGKRSNLDIKWKRPFTRSEKGKLNNYIGVKYHIRYDLPEDRIALHNFRNGYCGIVKVEKDEYCLCYLTAASNLKKSGNDLKKMEHSILSANPHLHKIFRECEMLWDTPVTISQISYRRKSQVEDHVLMTGDAAGMITPLCGNGMSMALHGSKIAAALMTGFLQGNITRKKMEEEYARRWRTNFASRLRMGRAIQRMFGSVWLSNVLVKIGRSFPSVTRALIRKTHGSSF
ncbi:MAG TPA: NAD(P)/FAD-dependent oxidoreductase [Chitinophagaceae bacterium]|nr:NAD(P)/FAD-dependent oxidoreductase [Chitinophagaceae bacterium]